jgi:hypothetical protein
MGLRSLVYLPSHYHKSRQGRQDRQDGVQLQLELVWSRKGHAWLGIP